MLIEKRIIKTNSSSTLDIFLQEHDDKCYAITRNNGIVPVVDCDEEHTVVPSNHLENYILIKGKHNKFTWMALNNIPLVPYNYIFSYDMDYNSNVASNAHQHKHDYMILLELRRIIAILKQKKLDKIEELSNNNETS